MALAPLVLVGLAVGSLTLADLYVGGHDRRPWVWLGTLLRPVTIDPPPAALLGRPATWHLVYLLGAAVVLGALAVWRSQAQARARRRTQAVTGAVLVAALAVTTAAAVVQTRPTSPALVARRLAAASNPAAALVCQRRGPAVYCVFPGFEPQIGLWEPTVRAVLAGVPPAAAARAVPVTVAQRIGWHRLIEEEGPDGLPVGGNVPDGGPPAQPGGPVAPVGTAWTLELAGAPRHQRRRPADRAVRDRCPVQRRAAEPGSRPKAGSRCESGSQSGAVRRRHRLRCSRGGGAVAGRAGEPARRGRAPPGLHRRTLRVRDLGAAQRQRH